MPAGNDVRSGDDAELNDDEISLLCDVGDTFPATLTAEKQARLESLIARGFVGEKLKSYRLAEREVVRAVHFAHAAFPEQGDDAIARRH